MPELAPSPALVRFAERLVRITKEFERRSEDRHFFTQPVVVLCVDEELRPLGGPLAAVTRDTSSTGIGLIFDRPMDHDLAAIHLEVDGEDVCLLIQALWRRPMDPFELVGGRVLEELEYLPA